MVTGDRSEVFKIEPEILFVLVISITLCADSVATVSLDQILCFNNVNGQKITKSVSNKSLRIY